LSPLFLSPAGSMYYDKLLPSIMKTNSFLVAVMLYGGPLLHGQKAGTLDSKQEPLPKAYYHRISFGATLSVLGLDMVPGKTSSNVTTSPAVDAIYTTTAGSKRIGFGGVVQLALTERFAVNVSLLTRRIGYKMNGDIFTGTDNPTTPTDERKHTVTNEDTRAKLYDLPIMVQYYNRDRHAARLRWFVEGGGVLRRVSDINTSIDTTINAGTTSCCTTTPIVPANRTTRGAVAGAGVLFKDDFGIHIVPEFRYTRWLNQTFQSNSTGVQRNQLEAMVSLTF